MDFGLAIAGIDALAREAALFAGVGFLVGGLDDLAADAIYLTRPRQRLSLPTDATPLRYAVLVPAWDEAAVIGDMLRATLAAWGGRDYRLYVAAYPNDVATIAAVGNVAARDPRVRLAIGERPGPTTKGCNLNVAWRAICRDEAAEDWHADAVVLHDAEDLVDRAELATYDRYLADHDYVQLPVLPLIASDSRWVSAHYADEFAEVHHRNLIIRERLGAGVAGQKFWPKTLRAFGGFRRVSTGLSAQCTANLSPLPFDLNDRAAEAVGGVDQGRAALGH